MEEQLLIDKITKIISDSDIGYLFSYSMEYEIAKEAIDMNEIELKNKIISTVGEYSGYTDLAALDLAKEIIKAIKESEVSSDVLEDDFS